MPEARAVPLRVKKRKLGLDYGMSFCSPWKRYFARDLACLHHKYGIIGFKEDHNNIRVGDIAALKHSVYYHIPPNTSYGGGSPGILQKPGERL